MHILVYKHTLAWPRRSGHDVHTYEMMRAWCRSGVRVNLVTSTNTQEQAVRGINLESVSALSQICPAEEMPSPGHGLPEKFIRYWGIPPGHISKVANLAHEMKVDAVVASGLDALPFLYQVRGAVRVWYAADEWLWHHLSLLRMKDLSTWLEVKPAVIKGLYERAFRRWVDRVWVVSNADRRAMRIVSAIRDIDVIPNGVDTEYFAPQLDSLEREKSLIFWGSLDFEPNVQGLEWFCRTIWPSLVGKYSEAVFTIVGARPIDSIRALAKMPGIRLIPNLDDLRPEVSSHQIVVLPFISGGGIKNKLLEAAAMGKAIVCSKKAARGLSGAPPIKFAHSTSEWIRTIEELWSHPEQRSALASSARHWVYNEHNWEKAATAAICAIGKSRSSLLMLNHSRQEQQV